MKLRIKEDPGSNWLATQVETELDWDSAQQPRGSTKRRNPRPQKESSENPKNLGIGPKPRDFAHESWAGLRSKLERKSQEDQDELEKRYHELADAGIRELFRLWKSQADDPSDAWDFDAWLSWRVGGGSAEKQRLCSATWLSAPKDTEQRFAVKAMLVIASRFPAIDKKGAKNTEKRSAWLKRARDLASCGRYCRVAVCNDCSNDKGHVAVREPHPFHCDQACCPIEAKRHRKKTKARMAPALKLIKDPVFITFGARNTNDLKKALEDDKGAWRRIRNHPIWKSHVAGGVPVNEHTPGRNGSHHPHAHIAADRKSFFPRRLLVPVIQKGYGCRCNARRTKNKSQLYLCCHSKNIDLATAYDYCTASPRGDPPAELYREARTLPPDVIDDIGTRYLELQRSIEPETKAQLQEEFGLSKDALGHALGYAAWRLRQTTIASSQAGDCSCRGTAIEPVAISITKLARNTLANEIAKYLSKGTKTPSKHFTDAEQLADVIQHYWKAKRWTTFGNVFKKLAALKKPKKEALHCPQCGGTNIRTIPEECYRPRDRGPP